MAGGQLSSSWYLLTPGREEKENRRRPGSFFFSFLAVSGVDPAHEQQQHVTYACMQPARTGELWLSLPAVSARHQAKQRRRVRVRVKALRRVLAVLGWLVHSLMSEHPWMMPAQCPHTGHSHRRSLFRGERRPPCCKGCLRPFPTPNPSIPSRARRQPSRLIVRCQACLGPAVSPLAFVP